MKISNKSLIVIPARYGSKRLPGKPLMMIAGKSLLQRVCETAQQAAQLLPNVDVLVATDDERILKHATSINVAAVMTPAECATGTDRVIAAIQQLELKPRAVINLQGDAPLTPASIISSLLKMLANITGHTMVTPVVQLSWPQLDSLRNTKLTTPFSGTTAILNSTDEAIWFSKQIIPAIRAESSLRSSSNLSPVYQHLGIYGYTLEMLNTFASLQPSHYEQLESLEQLRVLENGYKIQTIKVVLDNLNAWRGVDTIEDAKFVEQLLGAQ